MNGEYYYRVSMTNDYLTVMTTVSLVLDEYTGNCGPEAYRQAIIEADAVIEDDRKAPARPYGPEIDDLIKMEEENES